MFNSGKVQEGEGGEGLDEVPQQPILYKLRKLTA